MPQTAISSLSVDLCLERAANVLGGERQQTLLALAEESQLDLDTFEIAQDALQSLGGDVAAAPVAATLMALAAELSESTPPAKASGPNLTSQWLARNGRKVFSELVKHLTHRLPTSRRIGVIEDHVQTFLTRLIEKDTLASFILEGGEPKLSVLRAWVHQSACTEMRGWGVDASLRASRGAKTNRDRQADLGRMPLVVVNSEEPVVERRYEVEGGEVTDYYDPSSRSAEDIMISEEIIEAAKFIVRYRIPGGADRYGALFESMLDGVKRCDLADDAGVSRNRMASMVAQIRDVLRREVARS